MKLWLCKIDDSSNEKMSWLLLRTVGPESKNQIEHLHTVWVIQRILEVHFMII